VPEKRPDLHLDTRYRDHQPQPQISETAVSQGWGNFNF